MIETEGPHQLCLRCGCVAPEYTLEELPDGWHMRVDPAVVHDVRDVVLVCPNCRRGAHVVVPFDDNDGLARRVGDLYGCEADLVKHGWRQYIVLRKGDGGGHLAVFAVHGPYGLHRQTAELHRLDGWPAELDEL